MIKKLVIAVVFIVMASLSAVGCTTPTTNPTPTPSPTSIPSAMPLATLGTPTPIPQTDAAAQINRYFARQATVATPFTSREDANGRAVFTGVINDGSNKLTPWSHKITFTICKDRNDAKAVFSKEKTKAIAQGYGGLSSGGTDTTWYGYVGDYVSRTKEVYIMACQPDSPCGRDYPMTFQYDFVVSTDYMAKMT
ncbi:MAG: hypothetical protein ACXV3D_03935 [Halobacteriota archaeon]